MKEYILLEDIKKEFSARPELITELNKFSKVVVVSRGGFGAVSVLSQFLQTRWYDTACVSSYTTTKEQTDFQIHKLTPTEDEVLIVEDMVDTGATIAYLKTKFPQAKIFSLHYKPEKTSIKPDYYLWETNKWVVYPWELD